MSMVGSDERRGRVEIHVGAPTSKLPGIDVLVKAPRTCFFPAAGDLKSAPLDRAAPLAADVLLIDVIELNPHGWVNLTSRALVDVERVPFHAVASRLSAARSNTRVL
jgi:hypothetical protein